MVVFAANVTNDTFDLIDDLLATNVFVRFKTETKLDLSDNTILIRLAIINLKKHLPSKEEVARYKVALLRPSEFDDFLETETGGMRSDS